MGWFADPIYFGDYPPCMKQRLGEHLPRFTEEESSLLKGSVIGPYLLNTYGGRYAHWDDSQLEGFTATFTGMDGTPIGPEADSPWLHAVPAEIREHLTYVAKRYKPDGIFVTENGCDVPGENDMPLEEALRDQFRVDFYRGYLAEVAAAVKEHGVKLLAYTAWALMDNYEWSDGYAKRFGITYVNYTTQQRYTKASLSGFMI
jgi:beta-glucosidase